MVFGELSGFNKQQVSCTLQNSCIIIEHICKVIFHGSFAVYAYTVFSGKEWVPWYLGGLNNIHKLCQDYPFTELDPKIYMFMLVSLG